jgi:cell wall-associated NlpC family hydrolase
MARRTVRFLPLIALATALLSACSSLPRSGSSGRFSPQIEYFTLADRDHASEIVMMSFSLVDTGYRFGGRNPEAGLDCSGMVSYVVEQVSGQRLPHNAAEIAARTRPVGRGELHPGDLVFFNTGSGPYSHMGIYLGEGKFIHAPSSQGRVRVESLESPYFSRRFEAGRTLLPAG